ncbi:enoyl-CoA hydratase/isomerase family protein [Streptomyces cinereoruber]|uniref:enoyl-CoA hydratase/isomerase family protein n=1 Tax=Streptomyces cinereoruber TaxID=67260 RepID=UPI003632B14C
MNEELLRDRVRWVRDGAVARIELASPGTRNALDGDMALALHEAASRLVAGAAEGSLRVAILTAQGPVFSVGGDLLWFAAAPDPSRRIAETATLLHETLHILAQVPLPVVSVLHGTVAGGGIGIALGADIVLAGDDAKLRVAYTAAGLSPDCGVSWFLARRIGQTQALDLALTNRMADAEEPSLAFKAHLDAEAASITDLLKGPDGREDLSAFLEKRAPLFTSTSIVQRSS